MTEPRKRKSTIQLSEMAVADLKRKMRKGETYEDYLRRIGVV